MDLTNISEIKQMDYPGKSIAENDMPTALPGQPASGNAGALNPQPALPKEAGEILKELLYSYGLKNSDENINLLNTLLENKMPLNLDTVQKLNQFLKLVSLAQEAGSFPETGANMEKALFLMNNEVAPTFANATILETIAYTAEKNMVLNLMEEIVTLLENIPDAPLKEAFIKLFSEPAAAQAPFLPVNPPQAKAAPDTNAPAETGAGAFHQIVPEGQSNEIISLITAIRQEVLDQIPEALFDAGIEQGEPLEQGFQATIKNFAEAAQTNGSEMGREQLTELSKLLFKEEAARDLFSNKIAERLFPKNPSGKETIKALLREKLAIDPERSDPKEISKSLNEIASKLERAQKLAEETGQGALGGKIIQARETFHFISQLKTCTYIPFYLNHATSPTEGELYVFKDKRPKGGPSDIQTALVALNTVNLGRIETLIQKKQAGLNLQFRLEAPDTEKVIRSGLSRLEGLLKGSGLYIAGLTIGALDRPFNILQKPGEDKGEFKSDSIYFDTKA